MTKTQKSLTTGQKALANLAKRQGYLRSEDFDIMYSCPKSAKASKKKLVNNGIIRAGVYCFIYVGE